MLASQDAKTIFGGGLSNHAVREFTCRKCDAVLVNLTPERPREAQSMKRSLFRITAYIQLGIIILMSCGCAPTQPFFLNESPDLQHYLSSATQISYPDVQVESLAETTEALPPLSLGNHDYQFWDLSLEECVSIALQNSKYFVTTSGNAEFRQNVAAQFSSGAPEQFGSIYDLPIQQSTTQTNPLTVDGNGNRILPNGALRATQVGGVEDALAEFDAQASGFIDYSTTDRAQNVGVANVINPVQSQAANTTQQSAISKRLATGGVATLRQQILYSRNNTPILPTARAVPSDWTAIIEAQVQHPLARNRGTLINRIPVVLASLNEDVAIVDFEVQVRNLVRDIENAYWDLYVAYRNVSTTSIGRNSAIATAQFATFNLENGTGTAQEVAQAKEQYFQFKARLQANLSGSNVLGDDRLGVYGMERILREKLGLTATDGRLIRPIDEPSIARVEFDWYESVAQMLYLSPELRRDKFGIKQSELELITAKNQILPEVNLSLLYRWVGVGDTLGPPDRRDVQFPAPGSSALGSLTGGGFQEGAVRLDITPPSFGARRELTRIRASQLRLAQRKAFLQDKERILVSQLSDAIAKLRNHYEIMQTNALRWQAADQEVEARLSEFKNGRSPVNVVLQSQQRKAEAQISYYRAVAEYNKSINYVDYLKGTMLANSNITLAEGPWHTKAYCDALERARERSAGKHLQYGVTRPGVVRTGPVRDPSSGAEITRRLNPGFGQGLNTGVPIGANSTESIPGEIQLGPSNVPNQMGADLYSEPTIIDSVPLGEMGTPQEMFYNEPNIVAPNQSNSIDGVPGNLSVPGQELSVPLESGESILTPPNIDITPPAPQTVPQTVPQSTPRTIQKVTPSPESAVGSGVTSVNYRVSDLDVQNAPRPVSRTPLPIR